MSAQPSATASSGGVSSFDLEPNPFEQSFGSTTDQTKDNLLKQATSASQRQPSLLSLGNQQNYSSRNNSYSNTTTQSFNNDKVPGLSINDMASLGSSTNRTTTTTTNNNTATINVDDERKRPSISLGRPSSITSPPLLTPGGSRRLPPLLLSPSYVQQANSNPSSLMAPTSVGSLLGSTTSPLLNNTNTSSANNNENNTTTTTTNTNINTNPTDTNPLQNRQSIEGQLSSIIFNLPKTGLTPNESSIRSGLTPGLLSQNYYPILPSISQSPIPSSSINKNVNTTEQNNVSNSMNGVPFTPGMTSLLGFSNVISPPLNTQENASQQHQQQQPHLQLPQQRQRQQNPKTSSYIETGAPMTMIDPRTTTLSAKNAVNQNHDDDNNTITTGSITKNKNSSTNQNGPAAPKKRRKKSTTASTNAVKKEQELQQQHQQQQDTNENTTGNTNTDSQTYDEEDQERKRKEFLERNRVAASKFRQRKKEYIKKIEGDLNYFHNEYEDYNNIMKMFLGPPLLSSSSSSNVNGNSNLRIGQHEFDSNGSSLINKLENSIMKNDGQSSLTILNQMKQILISTKYYERGGRDPVRENISEIGNTANFNNTDDSRNNSISGPKNTRPDIKQESLGSRISHLFDGPDSNTDNR
ncbi:Sko1p NDAI_0F03270 [Naumovozyma dairenensis CBS 421]|uniref:BZIP domain-containing protein n=1 Tax=Naumovozyma dairenensis (strain ATCC 10597 / BCRC 20456 / CBS 421 / NBRC 0211 / NRRL Y-12639) TaxID=1071378 RepID=G0WCY4_NAUDC|nr:hypothetical protein NDAI_0F03270 [Naumovozyma dairenensis CBS 421]CCD25645.1 hypothetical protein NDAI_0F03270 [Naumovozyma dairenensis CBS 421]